ncbi:MAG TPA: hypothetical protein PLJ21_01460, partial [Pseudobdellovibrionaceae bacterium]|nr:hypothetical protein [Pseudobdellovibrionaceae bacterium]
IYYDLKDQANYIKTTEELLSLFEEKYPLASVRYKLGELFFKEGQIKKATEVWSQFKGKENQFWSSLSQERLKEAAWNDDYKKYIKRIPAMSKAEVDAGAGGN